MYLLSYTSKGYIQNSCQMRNAMNLLKNILTDSISLFIWIAAFVGIAFLIAMAFYYWNYYSNLEQNNKIIQECMAQGYSEQACKDRVY